MTCGGCGLGIVGVLWATLTIRPGSSTEDEIPFHDEGCFRAWLAAEFYAEETA